MAEFEPNPGSRTGHGIGWLTRGLDLAFGKTEGQILQRGPNKWQVLTAGTSGTILQSNGSGSLLTWLDPAPIANSLASNVTITNSATFYDGPVVAQGSTGVWFVSGTVTIIDTAAAATMTGKLWDGTTIIASARVTTPGASFAFAMSLSGFISSPAGNLRISVASGNATNGLILANNSGLGKDSTITAYRIK